MISRTIFEKVSDRVTIEIIVITRNAEAVVQHIERRTINYKSLLQVQFRWYKNGKGTFLSLSITSYFLQLCSAIRL